MWEPDTGPIEKRASLGKINGFYCARKYTCFVLVFRNSNDVFSRWRADHGEQGDQENAPPQVPPQLHQEPDPVTRRCN